MVTKTAIGKNTLPYLPHLEPDSTMYKKSWKHRMTPNLPDPNQRRMEFPFWRLAFLLMNKELTNLFTKAPGLVLVVHSQPWMRPIHQCSVLELMQLASLMSLLHAPIRALLEHRLCMIIDPLLLRSRTTWRLQRKDGSICYSEMQSTRTGTCGI